MILFADVMVLRGTIRLPGGYFDPDFVIYNLLPDYETSNFSSMLTTLGTVQLGQVYHVPITLIQRFR